jgi:hypothetical protein
MFREEPAKLIINRRAIAAGLAALVAAPMGARGALAKLKNVPLEFDAGAFAGQMQNGLFLADYRFPKVRLVFENGDTTRWHQYGGTISQWNHEEERYEAITRGPSRPGNRAVAIETCAPDKNGMPRYAQLAIG